MFIRTVGMDSFFFTDLIKSKCIKLQKTSGGNPALVLFIFKIMSRVFEYLNEKSGEEFLAGNYLPERYFYLLLLTP
jgi:hypothetical protein